MEHSRAKIVGASTQIPTTLRARQHPHNYSGAGDKVAACKYIHPPSLGHGNAHAIGAGQGGRRWGRHTGKPTALRAQQDNVGALTYINPPRLGHGNTHAIGAGRGRCY